MRYLDIMNVSNIFKYRPKRLNQYLKLSKVIIKSLICFMVVSLLSIYYQTEIYDFHKIKASNESSFYNPYQDWDTSKVFKANFHAHSQAWKGLTNGHNTEDEIRKSYKKLGYSVAAVSNYHTFNDAYEKEIVNIPCYEHGYNVSKTHLLAINASKVDKLDFPIGQGISQKQQRILNIKKNATLVALAHPGLRGGFSKSDLQYLKAYDLMEVISPYYNSFELYDFALNENNVSWILANDDTHDLSKQLPGRYFNLISSKTKSKNDILESLKMGKSLAYASESSVQDIFLESIKINYGTINFSFKGNFKNGYMYENGLKHRINQSGTLRLNEKTKYIRFEIHGKKSILYTNPVIRTNILNGLNSEISGAKIDFIATLAYRFLILLLGGFILLVLYRKIVFGKKIQILNKKLANN